MREIREHVPFPATRYRMRSKVYFDWVASDANISDWPSRNDKRHLIEDMPGAHQVPLVLPDPYLFEGDLSEWFSKVTKTVGNG